MMPESPSTDSQDAAAKNFETFLWPPSEVSVQSAAEHDPVIIINISYLFCHMILDERYTTGELRFDRIWQEQIDAMAMKCDF